MEFKQVDGRTRFIASPNSTPPINFFKKTHVIIFQKIKLEDKPTLQYDK